MQKPAHVCCRVVMYSCYVFLFRVCRLIVVEDVQPDPIVEVIPQHQRNVPISLPSPPHHQQQQQQQYQQQQHHSKYQPQLNQHQDNHHLQTHHRQPEMKSMASTRTGATTSEVSQSTRSATSSTVVYCSQPNMLGKTSDFCLFLYLGLFLLFLLN